MMEWIFRCLAVCTLLGGCASAPRGSLRDLNGQINLLRTYFQREIDDLCFEVFDLKTELTLEKAKTARLEDLLNGTGSIAELGAIFHGDISQQYVGHSRNLEDEDAKIETVVADLRLVKETIAQLEDAVRDNKNNLVEVQEIARNISIDMRNETPKEQRALGHSLSALYKAFQDEKDRCKTIEAKLLMITEEEIKRSALNKDDVDTLQTDIQLLKKVTDKTSRDITDMHTYLTRTNESASNIVDMQTDIQLVKEEIAKTSRDITVIQKYLPEMAKTANESASTMVDLQQDMQLVRDELNNSNKQLGHVLIMLHDLELVTTQHTEALDQNSETLAPIKKAQEEEARKAVMEEAKKAAMEEARNKAAMEEARNNAVMEEVRKAAMEEARNKAAMEEARHKAAMEEARIKAAMEEARKQRCLSIINGVSEFWFWKTMDDTAGGQGLTKLLYVGVTVKRGVDWKWGNQDGGGEGEVTSVDWNRLASFAIRVLWKNGHRNAYRMGYGNAYDLMIVADKYDFSRCPP